MTEALMIDFVVIALLGATIFFAFKLDRRLQGVRNVQNELAGVIRELNIAAARAEAGIQGLKQAAHSSGQQLEEQINNARVVGDELAALLKSVEKSGRAAERVAMTAAPPAPLPAPSPVNLRAVPPTIVPASSRQASALDALRSLAAAR
jgi:hypothetical protein